MRAETSDPAAVSPFSTLLSETVLGWDWSSTLAPYPPPKPQSLNGPDGPEAVGFGEAWQHVGNSLWGRGGEKDVNENHIKNPEMCI